MSCATITALGLALLVVPAGTPKASAAEGATGAIYAGSATKLSKCATSRPTVARQLRRSADSAKPWLREVRTADVRGCHGRWAYIDPQCYEDCGDSQFMARYAGGRWRWEFGFPASEAQQRRVPAWVRDIW